VAARRPSAARSASADARAARFVVSTAPPRDAGRLARALVTARVAACVNVVPRVASTYRWKGRVETAGESLLLVKTTGRSLRACLALLGALHPYEVPEALVLRPHRGFRAYLAWMDACSGK
jgi:periplasmic divalent cation tolerance protein